MQIQLLYLLYCTNPGPKAGKYETLLQRAAKSGEVKSGCSTALGTIRTGIPKDKGVLYKPKEIGNC